MLRQFIWSRNSAIPLQGPSQTTVEDAGETEISIQFRSNNNIIFVLIFKLTHSRSMIKSMIASNTLARIQTPNLSILAF